MKRSSLLLALALIASLFPVLTFAEVFMVENFESGDLVKSNNAGFKWQGPNNTSVTRGISRPGSPGDQALRFNYPAGQFMSEQRLDLGTAYRELWLRSWLKVRGNFEQPKNPANQNRVLA